MAFSFFVYPSGIVYDTFLSGEESFFDGSPDFLPTDLQV